MLSQQLSSYLLTAAGAASRRVSAPVVLAWMPCWVVQEWPVGLSQSSVSAQALIRLCKLFIILGSQASSSLVVLQCHDTHRHHLVHSTASVCMNGTTSVSVSTHRAGGLRLFQDGPAQFWLPCAAWRMPVAIRSTCCTTTAACQCQHDTALISGHNATSPGSWQCVAGGTGTQVQKTVRQLVWWPNSYCGKLRDLSR